ncbi:MAG: zinc ribbon domain-containing protein [Acidobacteria bacterium]|nr:zinc ribbon domain-containing protein [Acidobacteriota bacterium]
MYCPSCGTEERNTSQFCRACGMDMRPLRTALQKPDAITVSATSAREEIGRAIATKIQTLKSASDLKKVAEEVLPEVEKFLESPAERRLRRLRAGVITSAVGLGATTILLFSKVVIMPIAMFGWSAGLLVFLIGLGVIINGLLFSTPKETIPDRTIDRHSLFANEQQPNYPLNNTNHFEPPSSLFTNNSPSDISNAQYLAPPPSVTEHTTRQLQLKKNEEPTKRTTAEIQ